MQKINANTIYELVDTRTGDRYIGQTRKDLETTRLAQHWEDAKRGNTELHQHLQQVAEEERKDDIEIRPLEGFESENAATHHFGLANLLNGMQGQKSPPGGRYTWLPEELNVIEEHGTDAAADILREEHDREETSLRSHIRDTRAQLAVDPAHPGPLSEDDVLTVWVAYYLDESQSYSEVADRVEEAEDLDVSVDQVGRIVREDLYTDVDKPSKAAIEAAEAYVDAEAAFHACARTDASYAVQKVGADA